MSFSRQNYADECESGVNRQINIGLHACYAFSSMAFHFDRDDVALPGFHKYFKQLSDVERDHAEQLIKYQNTRGGRVLLQDIKKPETTDWGSGLDALTAALKIKKSVNQSLVDLHNIAESKNDVQFAGMIKNTYLKNEVESIKQITDYIAMMNSAGPGRGEYLFDTETLLGS